MTKLGQHFLLNKKKIGKIVEALDLKSGDVVIEIGPGHGELTESIKYHPPVGGSSIKIIAIEKDENLADFLREKFSQDKNIEIIEGDALKILPNLVNSTLRTSDVHWTSDVQKLKIVGNIPYYITGYLFRILGELENKPSLIVLTIQKEVAQRICAKPPKMNLLAASAQFWAEPKIVGYVPKKDFRPAPKVDSAIIKLKPFATASCSSDKYYKFIKILFKQPRKTILNNLVASIKHQVVSTGYQASREKIIKKLQEIGVDPQARPQNLSIEQIKELSKITAIDFLAV